MLDPRGQLTNSVRIGSCASLVFSLLFKSWGCDYGDVIIIIIIHVDDEHVDDDGDVLPGRLLDQTGPLAHTRCTEISYFRFRLEWDDFLFSIDMARSLLIWQKKMHF